MNKFDRVAWFLHPFESEERILSWEQARDFVNRERSKIDFAEDSYRPFVGALHIANDLLISFDRWFEKQTYAMKELSSLVLRLRDQLEEVEIQLGPYFNFFYFFNLDHLNTPQQLEHLKKFFEATRKDGLISLLLNDQLIDHLWKCEETRYVGYGNDDLDYDNWDDLASYIQLLLKDPDLHIGFNMPSIGGYIATQMCQMKVVPVYALQRLLFLTNHCKVKMLQMMTDQTLVEDLKSCELNRWKPMTYGAQKLEVDFIDNKSYLDLLWEENMDDQDDDDDEWEKYSDDELYQ